MNQVSVSNLNLASFLLVRGFSLDHLDQNGPTVIFVFSDPEGIGKQVLAEYYKDPVVPVKSFVAAMKQCRDMMFEIKRELQYRGLENAKTYKPAGR